MSTATSSSVRPFALFAAEVARTERVTPHLVRVTLAGPELRDFADNGYDQRIKLVLPQAPGSLELMPTGEDWFSHWRLMDTAVRPAIRTYTVRAVRNGSGEIDIDMVDHGDTGPASSFAGTAGPGDAVLVSGPHGGYEGVHGGLEFRVDLARSSDQLIVGDDTAVPAVAGILERLPESARGLACLEVGSAEDVQDLRAPAGVTVTWCVRGEVRGAAQLRVVREWLEAHPVLGGGEEGGSTVFIDGSDGAYWEVTTDRGQQAPPVSAWIAGESSVVRRMRRVLVGEYGMAKSAVAFMGYWREGHREC